jgi:hypothetical protein
MRRRQAVLLAFAWASAAGACSPSGPRLPTLPPASPSAQIETGAMPSPQAGAPLETVIVVAGTPTEIYARVASGALRCWLGTHGPIKTTHVFNAEAAPPSEGGVAEIVLHERDVSFRDQRGARAFRVSFVADQGNVRVGVAALKMHAPLSDLMAKDVEAWAYGGAGCQAASLSPPKAAPAAPADKTPKTKGSGSAGR